MDNLPSTIANYPSVIGRTMNKSYCERSRDEALELLKKRTELSQNNHNIFHGRLKHFLPQCQPNVSWQDEKKNVKNKMFSAEYVDQPDVLHEKVSFVVKLLQMSRSSTFYTGIANPFLSFSHYFL